MKDRYLFKAKTCNGKLVTGFLHCKDDKWYISNNAGSPFAYEVRPDTICQCTSLKDKNGNLIWEKDIIKCRLGKVIVLWNEAEWNIKKHDDFIWYKNLYYWVVSDRNIEVVGNIFDNPKLTEV